MATNKPYSSGSGKPDTKDSQSGQTSGAGKLSTGNDRDGSRTQPGGQTTRTPEADRGETTRDRATGENPDGMRRDKDSQRTGEGDGQSDREGTQGSVNDRDADTEEERNGPSSKIDRGSDTSGGM